MRRLFRLKQRASRAEADVSPSLFGNTFFGQCQKGVPQPANSKPETWWILGKVEASEAAERFNLRGVSPGGIGAKSSRLERRGVEGVRDATERNRAMALRDRGEGYGFRQDSVAADSVAAFLLWQSTSTTT